MSGHLQIQGRNRFGRLLPQVANWVRGVQGQGGSVSFQRQLAMSDCLNALAAAGVLPRLDRLWILAGENTQQALVDLIGANLATPVNGAGAGLNFLANRGYAGDGTGAYIDSNYNWSVNGVNFKQNDCCQGVWIDTAGNNSIVLGNENGAYGRMNAFIREAEIIAGVGAGSYAPVSNVGMFHSNRTGANAAANYGAGGVLEQSPNNVSALVGGRNYYILAMNYPTGFPSAFSTYRLSAVWMGGSLTPTQIIALNNALQTFFNTVAGNQISFMGGSLPAGVSLTRASTGWYFDNTGTLQSAGNNVARFTYPNGGGSIQGLLNEPNAIQSLNSNMSGAVAGVIGSGGALPSGWSFNITPGLSVTVATGTIQGMPYVDLTYAGTPTTTGGENNYMGGNPGVVSLAVKGDILTSQAFLALVAGSWANVTSMLLGFTQRNQAGGAAGPQSPNIYSTGFFPTATLTQYSFTSPMLADTTFSVQPNFLFTYVAGQPVNFTLRVAGPNLPKASAPLSTILTGTSAFTRAADIATWQIANGIYNMEVTRAAGITNYPYQVITTGAWIIPNDPSPVQQVRAI